MGVNWGGGGGARVRVQGAADAVRRAPQAQARSVACIHVHRLQSRRVMVVPRFPVELCSVLCLYVNVGENET